MHRQAVQMQGHDQGFATDRALARLAPGPGSLLVSLPGWQAAGLLGAAVATLARVVPSWVLICTLAHVWSRPCGAHLRSAAWRQSPPA